MNLDDFKKAQSLQVKMLAFKKLKEMLESEHVVLSSSKEKPAGVDEIFGQIFGDDERKVLNGIIKEEMVTMVDKKLSSLDVEFRSVGYEEVA